MALFDEVFLQLAESILDKVYFKSVPFNLVKLEDWLVLRLVSELKKEKDSFPTVEELETLLRSGLKRAITLVVGSPSDSDFAMKPINAFMLYSSIVFPALLDKLTEAAIPIEASEDVKRAYRLGKFVAIRQINDAAEYSIFVTGFGDRLRASRFRFPPPSAPVAPVDGSFHSVEQVERDAPATTSYDALLLPSAEPSQSFRYKKMMSESDLAAILRAVDKVPLTKTPFTGFGDDRSLSPFKVEITETVRRRHWSAVHEFHYLSRALESSLWLLVTVQLFNDLDPHCYVTALKQVWENLEKVCGGQLEQEQLLDAMIDLKQGSDESLSSFLGRVTRFRSQCQASGAMQLHSDSYFMMLSRRGMSSVAVSSQAASITCESWIEWVRQVIMIAQRLSPSKSASSPKVPEKSRNTTTPEVQQVATVRAMDFNARQDASQLSSAPAKQSSGHQPQRKSGQHGFKKCFTCGKGDHLTKQCPLRRCWNCLSVGHSASECPKSAPTSTTTAKTDSRTEAVRTVESTEATVQSVDQGETVILPSRSVVIRAWGDGDKLDGGILTATYGGKIVLRGLVDTGATDALLSRTVYDQIREHCPGVAPLIPCHATALLANGTTEEVEGIVKLDLIFCDRVITHEFYVIRELQPGIIWGLRLLGRVGVTIDIGDSTKGLCITTRVKSLPKEESLDVTEPGIIANVHADSKEIAVRRVSGVCCALSLEEAAPLLGDTSDDPLTSPLDTAAVRSFASPSCEEMEFDWRPIPAAPEYDYRVRHAKETDILDLPGEQEYVCEIRWPGHHGLL